VLTATPRHVKIAAQTVVEMPHLYGSLLHDAHTAILMREYGIRRIYTRDGNFHKFAFLEVIDPMAVGRPSDSCSDIMDLFEFDSVDEHT
jgi:predicted nucleic acid-binding protein